jgi:hypothetical protein
MQFKGYEISEGLEHVVPVPVVFQGGRIYKKGESLAVHSVEEIREADLISDDRRWQTFKLAKATAATKDIAIVVLNHLDWNISVEAYPTGRVLYCDANRHIIQLKPHDPQLVLCRDTGSDHGTGDNGRVKNAFSVEWDGVDLQWHQFSEVTVEALHANLGLDQLTWHELNDFAGIAKLSSEIEPLERTLEQASSEQQLFAALAMVRQFHQDRGRSEDTACRLAVLAEKAADKFAALANKTAQFEALKLALTMLYGLPGFGPRITEARERVVAELTRLG